MIIIVGIILFIILAVGYALCGDTSGIEAIGKGILYIALFLGIGWFIVEVPWLLILVVFGFIIWIFESSNNTNGHNSNANNPNNYQENTYENKTTVKPIENPTLFQNQLQQNAKSPQQVKDEQQSKEIEQAKTSASVDYDTIKRELLQQAENGNYTTINGHKCITYDYKYKWKPLFLGERSGHTYINKTMFNPSGQYASEIDIFITDNIYYNAYISEIKKLLAKNGITIQPFLLHKNSGRVYSLPHHSVDFGESVHHYEFVLRCSVQY